MNKKILTLILIACIALVVVGFIGLVKSDLPTNQSNEQMGNISPPETPAQTPSRSVVGAEQFLDVRIPDSIPSQRVDYTGFTLSFNKDNHTPNWVGWELLGTESSGAEKRYKQFWQDSEVEGCPTTADYTRSGFDRGHMCPAADQKWSPEAMRDCFSLANIVPQDNSLNTGAWSTLENKERLWAQRDSALLIIAGPIYRPEDRRVVGDTRVRVPSAFFKVLVAPYADTPRGIAFVYPNMSSPGNMENYVMTIRDVEKLTGYDFFHTMPADLQNQVETTASFHDWN